MKLINIITRDIKEPVSYIPFGILTGIAAVLLLFIICRIVKKPLTYQRLFYSFLLFIYGTVLCIQTFFSREPGSRKGIDFVLFSTWGTGWQAHAYVIENVIMFLPLGILFPMVVKQISSIRRIFWISLILSVGIELLQLVTSTGYCQVDDVVMNVLGSCLGYMLRNLFIHIGSFMTPRN